jgi:hypothetical protein
MSREVIPYPEIDCEEYTKALKQVSSALKRLGSALKPKRPPKTRAAAHKKR